MKISFSQRYGYTNPEPLQYESMSDSLFRRLFNQLTELENNNHNENNERIIKLIDHLGMTVTCREDTPYHKKEKISILFETIIYRPWNEIFDFFEYYVSLYKKKDQQRICKRLNVILEEENSGYRFINGLLTPITNEEEIKTIEKASHSKYEPVNCHINKAIALLSDKKNPDYNNTIKEAISAVESLCCIITPTPKATLGDALNKLESKGIQLHNSLKKAMHNLYGYTSDAGGIRHGSIDFTDADSSDARYMLITCSSFINYVIEKAEKI